MTDILITIFVVMALVLFWVMLYDSNRFVVKSYTVTDRRIRKSCRAVVLTDLHNKRYGKDNERLLAAIRDQEPDFVLIAGDILTASPKASMESAIQLLRRLAGEYPVYYANGNHEQRLKLNPQVYGPMADRYGTALREMGVEPLINAHISLPDHGITIYGSQIDIKYYKHLAVGKMPPNYMTELLGQAPGDVYAVLLAHNPDYFPQYAAWGADLTISGHVHGGVARVPFWGKGVVAPTWRLLPKYDGGVFKEGDSTMVLSRGLGSHTIPVRIFNPGELWVIEFQSDGTDVLS